MNTPIKSIVCCVEFDDFLSVTLPRNLRHFQETLVVTSPGDAATQALAGSLGCRTCVTDAFYRRGAAFNKGAAMEEGFDALGRSGWICVWDCDIVLPGSIDIPDAREDCLYAPARRMLPNPRDYRDGVDWGSLDSPTEPHEFVGYCQVFHASAVPPPWYSACWAHAGGCDSDFMFKFPEALRLRPPWEVLHLGLEGVPGIETRVGQNWRGRVSPRIDTGIAPERAGERLASVIEMLRDRERHCGVERERLT